MAVGAGAAGHADDDGRVRENAASTEHPLTPAIRSVARLVSVRRHGVRPRAFESECGCRDPTHSPTSPDTELGAVATA